MTDSQLLQQVLCGQARLTDETYEPLMQRVTDRIVRHFACGWIPPKTWNDPILWMRRSHNKVSDGLADLTMDMRKSWAKSFDCTLSVQNSNVVVQTDGGLRPGRGAAASYFGWSLGPLRRRNCI